MGQILKSLTISVVRKEANMDRACDEAYDIAVSRFGIDDCGHSDSVEGWERSSCYVSIEFKLYWLVGSVAGHEHRYDFQADAVKDCDE